MAGSRMSGTKSVAAVVLALIAVLFTPSAANAAAGTTTRVSVASDGVAGDGESAEPTVSGDGRYVAFESGATNLVPGDTNAEQDVFIRDNQTVSTKRVSVATDGTQANNASRGPDVSADGRYVAFHSFASNLVAGDTNGSVDIFVRDRQSGTTTRVNVASDGTQAAGQSGSAAISADGRYVAFESRASNLVAGDANQANDVFVHDRQTGTTTRVSLATAPPLEESVGSSSKPAISADGRYVAFQTTSPNPATGQSSDIFVRDRQSGTTTRVSVASDGSQANGSSTEAAISADGRYVAFESTAANLVAGDTNAIKDVFVRDLQSGTTARVSVASDGSQTSGSSSRSERPAISADGRYVTFSSAATNLVAGDTNFAEDVFVRDRQSGTTTRVSVASDGAQAGFIVAAPDISGDGRHVAFDSRASNLVRGDTNERGDVFVHDTQGVPGPPPVLVAVGNVSVFEGDAGTRAAVFTVSLYEPAGTTVSVNFATVDGVASAGTDYTAKSGALSFAPGTTSLSVKVPVIGDVVDEPGETFALSLSGAQGAIIADASGAGVIVDDDPPAVTGRRLTIGDASVYEGDAGTRVAVFNVSLSTPSSSVITVAFATANGSATEPGDYLGKTGTLSFAPGTTTLSVKVTVNPDTVDEPQENFNVVLSSLSGAKTAIFDGTGLGTIIDDD